MPAQSTYTVGLNAFLNLVPELGDAMLRRHPPLCHICCRVCDRIRLQQADPSKPEYWIAKLEMPNPKVAIDKLRDMRVQAAVDPLMKLYDKGKNKDAIVAALIKIGDKKALPVLVKAIGDNDEADTAKQAAAAVINGGLPQILAKRWRRLLLIPRRESRCCTRRYASWQKRL